MTNKGENPIDKFLDVLPRNNTDIYCVICHKKIHKEYEIFYVFLGGRPNSNSHENEPFCTDCYFQDVRNNRKQDPFIVPRYQKNFIRMNK